MLTASGMMPLVCADLLSVGYHCDPQSRVYWRSDASSFPYSDGEEAERRLASIVAGAYDRSTGSRELVSQITDWVTFYHLSPRRCDLLRPVADLLRGNVLEVGAGCGAITRFLGETARSVVALEGSMRRAEITSLRCRELRHVVVCCDNLEQFRCERQFDAIVCVGSVEYCSWFFPGPGSLGRMLTCLRRFLQPHGYLVIAIENRLGLKYFAGAPEDHTGTRYQGLQDQYGPGTAITLGRREWEESLERSGLDLTTCLYPFPSYKHPELIVTPAGFVQPELDLASLLRHHPSRDQDVAFLPAFSEQMVWPALLRNGLAEDLAPSFLLVAQRRGALMPARAEHALAYRYSTDRRRSYCKETRFEMQDGQLVVRRRALYPDAAAGPHYRQSFPQSVPYLRGDLYSDEVIDLLNRPGWTVDAIAEWARPWLAYLMTHAVTIGEVPHLPPDFVDHGAHNLLRREDGGFAAIDQEYVADSPVPVPFVVFRSLWATLTRVSSCAQPGEATPVAVVPLIMAIMERLGLASGPAVERELLRDEAELQEIVAGMDARRWIDALRAAALNIRGAGPAAVLPCVCQAFWRTAAEPEYTEARSVTNSYFPDARRQTVSLTLPAMPAAPVELRLDIANRAGQVRIFAVSLRSRAGTQIWRWSGELRDLCVGGYANQEFRESVGGGVVARFDNEDPILILPIDEASLAVLGSGGELEIDLAWLG